MTKEIDKNNIEDLKKNILKCGNLPQHVAIIMDGNGRWAKSRQLKRVAGHKEGINSVREIVETAGNLGIKYLTLYTFSTENWNRPKGEVTALMALLLRTIRAEVNDLKKNNVRLSTIGRLDDLPFLARQSMRQAIDILKDNTGLNLVLALSYSSRQEILDAVRKIAEMAVKQKISPESIDEPFFSAQMYTGDIPDPDLLIRTSGELRISNFLLWQLAYTEIYVTDVLWPDFRNMEFLKAIQTYQGRERRFGKVSEQLDMDENS